MPFPPLFISYAFSSLTLSLANYASGHFSREESKLARTDNLDFQQGLENQRREMQLAQMKLSVLQRQEDREFQLKLAQENHEFQREIEEFRQSVNFVINQNNLNFQKWQFERQKELQLEILNLNQAFQRELNQVQHQNALIQIEKRYTIERENPLLLLASRLLKSSFSNGVIPLKILLVPPELDYDVNKPQGSGLRIESSLAEEIRQFLRLGYGTNDPERPTELLDRAWSSKKFGGGSAIRYLHDELKSVPVLVLESEFANENVNLRLNYWDGEVVDPKFAIFSPREEVSILSRFSYRDFLLNSAKSRALEWRKTKAELLQNGLNELEIKDLASGYDEENLAILEQEEQTIAKLQALNKDVSRLNLGKRYKITNEDWEDFYNYFAFLHCVAIGTTVDILALQRSCQIQPLLPKLLPELSSRLNIDAEVTRETIKPIVELYRNLYKAIEQQAGFSSLIPDLTIDFALSLADLSDKSFAIEQAKYSASVWLKLHGTEPNKIFDLNSDRDCQLLKNIIYQEDEPYLIKLQQLVEKAGDAGGLEQIKSLLVGWQSLKRWGGGIPRLSDLDESKAKVTQSFVSEPNIDLTGRIDNYSQTANLNTEINKRNSTIYSESPQSEWWEQYETPDDIPSSSEKNAEVHSKRGEYHYNLGEYDKAIDEYTQAIRLNPEDAKAYFARGNCYLCLEEYHKSLLAYVRVTQLNPKNADGYFYTAFCFYKLCNDPLKSYIPLKEAQKLYSEQRNEKMVGETIKLREKIMFQYNSINNRA